MTNIEESTVDTTATTNTPVDKEHDDPYTLYVRGNSDDPKKPSTDPRGLSRSILHSLRQNPGGFVQLKTVGPTSLNIAMRAFRLACDITESRTKSVVLVMRQSEFTAMVKNKPTIAVCTRIISIEIKDAL